MSTAVSLVPPVLTVTSVTATFLSNICSPVPYPGCAPMPAALAGSEHLRETQSSPQGGNPGNQTFLPQQACCKYLGTSQVLFDELCYQASEEKEIATFFLTFNNTESVVTRETNWANSHVF